MWKNQLNILSSIYASGTYVCNDPEFDPNEPRHFDIDSKLALSRCSITGEEFYQAIPLIFGYRDNFTSYIKQIHELPDDDSWGGSAYFIKLEISENDRTFHENGNLIHPTFLDSIMHPTLAAFIDMNTKSFDYTETLLPVPVKIDQITRWDKGDNNDPSLDFDLRGTIWTYLTIGSWSPNGPCRSNLVVTNSEPQVLLTNEAMECAVAPREQFTMDECFTTIWILARLSSWFAPFTLRQIRGGFGPWGCHTSLHTWYWRRLSWNRQSALRKRRNLDSGRW